MGQANHYHPPVGHDCGRTADVATVLRRCQRLVLEGHGEQAVAEIERVPRPARTREVRLLYGDALYAAGDPKQALKVYGALDAAPYTSRLKEVAADLAWRMARVYQDGGQPGRALRVLRRARLYDRDGVKEVDRARVAAGFAAAHWLLGEAEQATAHARAAEAAANAAGDAGAMAAAQVALALTVSLAGDPAGVAEHYFLAAEYAREAADLAQLTRVNANLSHHLLADARFREAAATACQAAESARRLQLTNLEAVALGNEAEALMRLGRMRESLDRYERVLALAGRLGTRRTAGALVGLSKVYGRQGAHEQQRAALLRAERLSARADADRQVRVPAQAELARALVSENLDRADQLASEALAGSCGSSVIPALLAAGYVAMASGNAAAAERHASRAVEHARHRREHAWLAEALELRAEVDRPRRAGAALREAHGIWRGADAAYDADRVLIRLAALAPAKPQDRRAGRVAAIRAAATGHPPAVSDRAVAVNAFGRFEVCVDGTVVPVESWQSRRARDLLQLLVVRRERAVPRAELCETLWPGEDSEATAHRLSVLLSIVRGVLGSDALVADRSCVLLDRTRVSVDVEEFLGDVTDAAALQRSGSPEDARLLLADALRRRTDEPFADTPYDDLVRDLRDEVQAAYHRALRLMADLCRSAGQYDDAATWLRRLIADEPYDEQAHLGLMSVLTQCGRHGQARRAEIRYREAMAEIGVGPAGRLTVPTRADRLRLGQAAV